MAAPVMQKLHDKAQLTALSEGQLCQIFQVSFSEMTRVLMNLLAA